MNVNEILEQREKTHGSFAGHAAISQQLKNVMGDALARNQRDLSDMQYEALDMIAHKIARILNGNPNFRDHWDDIAGYATLVAKEL